MKTKSMISSVALGAMLVLPVMAFASPCSDGTITLNNTTPDVIFYNISKQKGWIGEKIALPKKVHY